MTARSVNGKYHGWNTQDEQQVQGQVKAVSPNLQLPPTMNRRKNSLMHTIYDAHFDVPPTDDGNDHGSGLRRRQLVVNDHTIDLDSVLHLVWKDQDTLLVEITASTSSSSLTLTTLRSSLEDYGFETTGCAMNVCSGFMDISTLEDIEDLPIVGFIKPSIVVSQGYHHRQMKKEKGDRQANTDTGGKKKKDEGDSQSNTLTSPVKSQAIEALQVDKLRALYPNLTGAGMKIGIISTDFNNLGGYELDVATGELPPNITVLREPSFTVNDEGRAMMQLIHDLAPDAEFVFRTGMEGPVDFAVGVQELADVGCDVIVDDLGKSHTQTQSHTHTHTHTHHIFLSSSKTNTIG
jgi:hypothetical protein